MRGKHNYKNKNTKKTGTMVALDRGPSERFTASSSGEDLPSTTTAWGKHNGRLFVRGHFPGH